MSKANSFIKMIEQDEKPVNVAEIISDLIKTNWSSSDEKQGKAIQLLSGLAFSKDEKAKKFMKAIDNFTSSLKVEDYK